MSNVILHQPCSANSCIWYCDNNHTRRLFLTVASTNQAAYQIADQLLVLEPVDSTLRKLLLSAGRDLPFFLGPGRSAATLRSPASLRTARTAALRFLLRGRTSSNIRVRVFAAALLTHVAICA